MPIKQGFPSINTPVAGPNGGFSNAWYLLLSSLWQRTGDATGVDTAQVEAAATAASAAAATAQAAASAAQIAATAAQTAAASKVAKSGDTMTGLLVLSADPTAPLGAVTKQYADAIAGGSSPSNAPPLVNGIAAPGTSALYSRGDHVHPTDTTRYAATNPAGYQTAAQVTALASTATPLIDGTGAPGTSTNYAREGHIHPTDTTRYAASNPSGYLNAVGVDGHTFTALKATGGLGVFGHAAPTVQPATPVTLADVIAILQGAGICA